LLFLAVFSLFSPILGKISGKPAVFANKTFFIGILCDFYENIWTPCRKGVFCVSVSMNRIVQRSAVDQARPLAGLSRWVRRDAPLFLEHAALTPIFLADAAFAATTPTNASDLAV
jgi:hypothetical protein